MTIVRATFVRSWVSEYCDRRGLCLRKSLGGSYGKRCTRICLQYEDVILVVFIFKG